MLITVLAVAACASFAAAFLCSWLLAKYAVRLGLVDVPNARSSHVSPTPRAGGIGVVAGVAAGLVALVCFRTVLNSQLEIVLLGSLAIAILGTLDDLHSVRASYRLVVQVIVATGVVVALGGVTRLPLPSPLDVSVGYLGYPLTIVWLVSVTNFFNFMDGIDGLAGGQSIASCVGVAVGAWSVGAGEGALVLAASAAGFLVLNRPPARIFLGDAGSTSIGFAIAGLPLLAHAEQRPMAVFAVAVGLSLFLLDPIETLVRLARHGHRIGVAHRVHSYQLLASTQGRRGIVAGALVGAGFVLAVAGGVAYRAPWAGWPVAILGLCAFAVERYLAGSPPPGGAKDQFGI